MAASMSPSKMAPRSISAQHRWIICEHCLPYRPFVNAGSVAGTATGTVQGAKGGGRTRGGVGVPHKRAVEDKPRRRLDDAWAWTHLHVHTIFNLYGHGFPRHLQRGAVDTTRASWELPTWRIVVGGCARRREQRATANLGLDIINHNLAYSRTDLVGDLSEQPRQPLLGVVEFAEVPDHADAAQEARQERRDLLWLRHRQLNK